MASLKPPYWVAALSGFVAFGTPPNPAFAAGASSTEIAVKATFLVKFASYVNWPASALPPREPLSICVIGRDPFGNVLDRAGRNQETNGHPVVIRRMASASQSRSCHLAYLGGSGRDVAAAQAAMSALPVVTVTDARVSKIKGIIHFQIVGGRVRFDINAAAASNIGVGISSQLLGLARDVRRERAR